MHACNTGSLRCDENQSAVIEGVPCTVMVHCIHPVSGYSTLFGYVRGESRRPMVRLVAGSDTWGEYKGSGLDREHYIGKQS